MEGALLSVENVSVYYHTPQGETEAVRDLSFSVGKGEFVAVVGPSGCGKTTVLSLIMGLNPPSLGEVRFPQGPCPMGYMLQRDNLLEWRTLEKNAVLGLEVRHKLNEKTRESLCVIDLDTVMPGLSVHDYGDDWAGGLKEGSIVVCTDGYYRCYDVKMSWFKELRRWEWHPHTYGTGCVSGCP